MPKRNKAGLIKWLKSITGIDNVETKPKKKPVTRNKKRNTKTKNNKKFNANKKYSNKKIINGLYVFYWDKDGIDFDSNNSDFPSGVQDISRSGSVSKSDYESYSIGDKYCYPE